MAAELRGLVPEARMAVAHGQMDEGTLEKVVFDFWEGRYDVLVCTTIIESGIDMPTVNTLVVDRADLPGPRASSTSCGAGWAGPGNGPTPTCSSPRTGCCPRRPTNGCARSASTPSWARASRSPCATWRSEGPATCWEGTSPATSPRWVTTCTCRWLAKRWPSSRVRSFASRPRSSSTCRSPPISRSDYVAREDLRLEVYRRLATVTTHGEVDDIRAEWSDRYGPLPEPAEALLRIGHLRAECARTGVREVAVVKGGSGLSGGGGTARLGPLALRASSRVRLGRLWPKAVYKEETGQLVLTLPRGADPSVELVELLSALVPVEAAPVASAAP